MKTRKRCVNLLTLPTPTLTPTYTTLQLSARFDLDVGGNREAVVKTLLGERDNMVAELCARRIVEAIDIDMPGRPLLLGLGLHDRSSDINVARDVIAVLMEKKPWK